MGKVHIGRIYFGTSFKLNDKYEMPNNASNFQIYKNENLARSTHVYSP